MKLYLCYQLCFFTGLSQLLFLQILFLFYTFPTISHHPGPTQVTNLMATLLTKTNPCSFRHPTNRSLSGFYFKRAIIKSITDGQKKQLTFLAFPEKINLTATIFYPSKRISRTTRLFFKREIFSILVHHL